MDYVKSWFKYSPTNTDMAVYCLLGANLSFSAYDGRWLECALLAVIFVLYEKAKKMASKMHSIEADMNMYKTALERRKRRERG